MKLLKEIFKDSGISICGRWDFAAPEVKEMKFPVGDSIIIHDVSLWHGVSIPLCAINALLKQPLDKNFKS